MCCHRPTQSHFNLVSAHSNAEKQPSSKSPIISFSPQTLVTSSWTSLQLLTPSTTPSFSPTSNPPLTSSTLLVPGWGHNSQEFISIKDGTSSTAPLSQGVPQGLVLGPLMLILYMLPPLVTSYAVMASTSTAMPVMSSSTKSITITAHSTLTNCLAEIKSWIQANFLKINQTNQTSLVQNPSPEPLTPSASPSRTPLCLPPDTVGVIFNDLLFRHLVKRITRTAFFPKTHSSLSITLLPCCWKLDSYCCYNRNGSNLKSRNAIVKSKSRFSNHMKT